MRREPDIGKNRSRIDAVAALTAAKRKKTTGPDTCAWSGLKEEVALVLFENAFLEGRDNFGGQGRIDLLNQVVADAHPLHLNQLQALP